MISLKMFTKHICTKKETFSIFKNKKLTRTLNRRITMAKLNLQQINALFYRITKAWEEKDPNKNKNYTMTESEVKNLVEERLSKLNLSLSTYKFKNNIDVYQAVKLEEIPKCKKQFCYIRDVFHGENILGLSLDQQKP